MMSFLPHSPAVRVRVRSSWLLILPPGLAVQESLLLYNKDLVKSRKSFGALFSSPEDADEDRLLITAIHYLFTGS
jgi:hypothetical protein